MEQANYIRALLLHNGKKPAGRRVWSLDLETVLLPFLTATNTMGDTAIPFEALGAPLRLAYNADGSVKFSKTGRPVLKVAKEIADTVRLMRENFTASLMAYASGVATENPDAYKHQIELSKEAGEPITTKDRANLGKAMAEAMAQSVAEAKASKRSKKEAVAV